MQDESSNPRVDSAAQEAADWVARRDRGFSPQEEATFAAWRRSDPRHESEWRRLSRAWQGMDQLPTVPELRTQADELIERARARRARARRCNRTLASLGVAAALAVGAFGWRHWSVAPVVAVTPPSENVRVIDSTLRRVALPDGSIAELNGSSRLEVAFTPTERRVRLVEGEAHFLVAKNPDRPFFVTAGAVTVRAVGTAFNVRLAQSVIEVLVTEGKVQVQPQAPAAEAPAANPSAVDSPEKPQERPAALVAGQRAVIERSAAGTPSVAIGDVGRAEIDEELGWQTTRLVFNNTPLDEVVANFNRYNAHQLTLGDPRLRRTRLTGAFRSDNLEGFVRLLRASVDVKAELRTPLETVLLPMH